MTKIGIYSFCLLGLLMSLVSCRSETEDLAVAGQQTYTLSFAVQLEESLAETRTATALDEAKDEMLQIQLFFYADNTLLWQAPTLGTSGIKQTNRQAELRIQVPEEVKEELEGELLSIYAVVNSPQITLTQQEQQLQDLQQKVISSPNLNSQPPHFLMTGMLQLSSPIKLSKQQPTQMGTIPLKRAAAQIRLLLGEAQAEGHPARSIEARLMNYAASTALDESYPALGLALAQSSYRPVDSSVNYEEQHYLSTADYFYSYENNWEQAEDSRNTYLLLKVHFEGIEQAYYYRVPLYYQSLTSQVKRNHAYLIKVNIHEFGTVSDTRPLDLEGEIKLFPFHGISISAHLDGESYLFVKDSEPKLYYKKDDFIAVEYISDSEVSWVLEKEYYYNAEEEEVMITLPQASPKGVRVKMELKDNKTYLKFEKLSPLPYITQHLEFRLENKSGAYTRLHLMLMGNFIVIPHEVEGVSTKMYEVQYTVSDGSVLNHPTDTHGYTLTDEASSHLVSPDYYFAPIETAYALTDGIKPNTIYRQAEKACRDYSIQFNGKTLGGGMGNGYWRIPTHDELHKLATVYMRSKYFQMSMFNAFYLDAKAVTADSQGEIMVSSIHLLAITQALRAYHAEGELTNGSGLEPTFAKTYTGPEAPSFLTKQISEQKYYTKSPNDFSLQTSNRYNVNVYIRRVKLRCVYDK